MNNPSQTLHVVVSRQKIGGPAETSLARAAARAGLTYRQLVVEDVSLDDLAVMTFGDSDLLYRVSVSAKASAIESALLTIHPTLTGMYWPRPTLGPTRRFAELFEQIAAGLPIIPTKIVDDSWSRLNDELLGQKVQQLGGLPVLFKTLGLAHGQGVQKLETLAELRQAIGQAQQANSQAILREYLPEYRHYRLIVVDDEVVAVIEYHRPADDFRTNASDTPDVSAVNLSDIAPEIIDIARRSVGLAASIIGGVDVLVDTVHNVPYLAEVNVPCNFARAEAPTGIDIGRLIVEALTRKSHTQRPKP